PGSSTRARWPGRAGAFRSTTCSTGSVSAPGTAPSSGRSESTSASRSTSGATTPGGRCIWRWETPSDMASLRLVRRLVRLVTGVLLLVGFALVVLVVAVRTPVGERQLREWIRSVLVQATDARVSIGRVGGSLISGFWAHDVLLEFPGGARVDAKELSASYALHVLLTGRIEIGSVRLRDVRVRALATAEDWGFVAPGAPASESPLPTLRIDRVVIEDGRVDLALGGTAPRRLALTQLSLDGSFAMDPRQI